MDHRRTGELGANLTGVAMPRLFPTLQRGRATCLPASAIFGVVFAETPQPEATAPNANRNACFANESGAAVNGNIVLGKGDDTVELRSESIVNGNSPIGSSMT